MKKDSLLWIQLTRPIEVQKGDILRLRIDNTRQYQPGVYQWLVTPLGKEENMIKLVIVNPRPVKAGMILKVLDMQEKKSGWWTCQAELIEALDPVVWDVISRAIEAAKAKKMFKYLAKEALKREKSGREILRSLGRLKRIIRRTKRIQGEVSRIRRDLKDE